MEKLDSNSNPTPKDATEVVLCPSGNHILGFLKLDNGVYYRWQKLEGLDTDEPKYGWLITAYTEKSLEDSHVNVQPISILDDEEKTTDLELGEFYEASYLRRPKTIIQILGECGEFVWLRSTDPRLNHPTGGVVVKKSNLTIYRKVTKPKTPQELEAEALKEHAKKDGIVSVDSAIDYVCDYFQARHADNSGQMNLNV